MSGARSQSSQLGAKAHVSTPFLLNFAEYLVKYLRLYLPVHKDPIVEQVIQQQVGARIEKDRESYDVFLRAADIFQSQVKVKSDVTILAIAKMLTEGFAKKQDPKKLAKTGIGRDYEEYILPRVAAIQAIKYVDLFGVMQSQDDGIEIPAEAFIDPHQSQQAKALAPLTAAAPATQSTSSTGVIGALLPKVSQSLVALPPRLPRPPKPKTNPMMTSTASLGNLRYATQREIFVNLLATERLEIAASQQGLQQRVNRQAAAIPAKAASKKS